MLGIEQNEAFIQSLTAAEGKLPPQQLTMVKQKLQPRFIDNHISSVQ
jgi:hypothetical protein